MRRHVAWALGEIGTVEALNALRERLTEETDPGAIEEIKKALSQAAVQGGKLGGNISYH